MSVTKAEVEATLALHEPEALRAILDAAQVSPRGAETPQDLAHRVTEALWWNYSTPLGYASGRTTLDDIVGHVVKKLGHTEAVGEGNAWWRLEMLTRAMALDTLEKHGVSLADIDPKSRERVWPNWMPMFAYGASASGSFGAWWTSGKVLTFLKGPVGRLLPLIPPIAPYVAAIRTGAGAVNVVAGPLGVALSVLTLNESLGTNYHQLVPLLLGVGALGPDPVEEAFEVAGTAEA